MSSYSKYSLLIGYVALFPGSHSLFSRCAKLNERESLVWSPTHQWPRAPDQLAGLHECYSHMLRCALCLHCLVDHHNANNRSQRCLVSHEDLWFVPFNFAMIANLIGNFLSQWDLPFELIHTLVLWSTSKAQGSTRAVHIVHNGALGNHNHDCQVAKGGWGSVPCLSFLDVSCKYIF